MEMLHQARFANPGLTHDQHYLTLTLKHTMPAIQQQSQFVLTSDERG